jgi:hypothetical protein
MRLTKEIERINLSILEGRLAEAEAALLALSPETTAEKRVFGHFQGILAFARGNIVVAKQQMEATLQKFGENVNLLRDLMVCQYHLQDMTGFRGNLARLEQQLTEREDHLSSRSLLECELMVGKFLEEEARLAPALEFYDRALARAINPAHKLRALIQKARWYALYEPGDGLSLLYRELISVPSEKVSRDLCIELEHSLMLIELRLIGADHAWQRIERLGANIPEIDQRQMCFDYVEGLLAQELEIPPAVLEKMSSFQELDPYEQYIQKIVKQSLEASTKIHELAVLAPQLPWASYLRLLCLSANVETLASARQELNRKIQLIIRALDTKSQSLWCLRLKQALQTAEIRVEYSSRNRSVAVQGRSVDLSKKKMGMQLLEGLSRKPELTVDEAITLLWQSSFTPEHYHRLRMGIHRLNTLINKVTGLGKIIEVDSQTVRLRPEVKIRHSDDSFVADLMNH